MGMFAALMLLLEPSSMLSAQAAAALQQQVRDAERAFAKTMADRDHAAFVSFLADEAIFLGPKEVLRGRKAVAEGWKRFFEGSAPFAWAPERVEVIDSGSLAISTGPVTDPTSGKRIGTFTTTWRRENGQWKVILDSGCPPCDCKATANP